VWQGEQPYKVTESEIDEEITKTVKETGGYILNRGVNFWARFVKDGMLDRDAVLKAKYRDEQLEYIETEMRRLGWLPSVSE
jgi:hypothetical protein